MNARVSVYCHECQEHQGFRVPREEPPIYGVCPKCRTPVTRAHIRADRQAEKAKADFARFGEHAS